MYINVRTHCSIFFFIYCIVLGTALAYNILLNIPFLAGVLICGASTFLLLGLQTYGVRFSCHHKIYK
jgi:Mn2+/Fe2+ NRAMP family transporter